MNLIWQGICDAVELIVRLDPAIIESAWLSIWISTFAVLLASVCGLPLGTFLARRRFWGRSVVIACFRASMAMPTVFVGVVCFALFARQGILGPLGILYTPWAIVAGELFLALPIVTSLTHGAVTALDLRVFETAKTLGAAPWRRAWTYLSEAHISIKLAILTAFARCFTELGIAMIVGGNIKHHTRTLSTATTIEVSQGEFAKALAMGLILLLISLSITIVIGLLSRDKVNSRRRT